MQQQVVETETYRMQLTSRVDKIENEAMRGENELALETSQQVCTRMLT
jgi:hypothetical protein